MIPMAPRCIPQHHRGVFDDLSLGPQRPDAPCFRMATRWFPSPDGDKLRTGHALGSRPAPNCLRGPDAGGRSPSGIPGLAHSFKARTPRATSLSYVRAAWPTPATRWSAMQQGGVPCSDPRSRRSSPPGRGRGFLAQARSFNATKWPLPDHSQIIRQSDRWEARRRRLRASPAHLPLIVEVRGNPLFTRNRVDDPGGNILELNVACVRRPDQYLERFGFGATVLRHDRADCDVDHRP